MALASQKALDALKGIGLNLYERKLWVALLARGTSTAGELSEIANVPRSRSYDILQSLAEKGFVVVQTAKPLKYVAVQPAEALDRAKKKVEEDMNTTMERIDELKSSQVLKELNSIFTEGMSMVTPEEMTGSLKGKYSVMQQLSSMFKVANKRINIVTTQEGLTDLYENHYNDLKKAVDRGVKVQIAASGAEKSTDACKALNDVAEIRSLTSKEVPISGRFAVVDGKELVFSLTDNKVHDTQHVAFWSKSEHAAGSLLEPLFKMVWNSSKPMN
ncbi:MAG: TrmB family transcriptional regulator [Candidatus Aenigmarchaeota archaeon]|nr:TrmB family transcriptional regulator [Candidatus Aenigmarchaeota archaeon]